MDLTEISAAVAISEEVITQYEFGEQRPSPGDLVALVRLFGVNLRELFPHPIAPTSRQIH
jgi:transcriptional regulator with XRE-family HTH domain